ncbi:hypothetical protein HDU93_004523 [Gonapodya sp. JEL0774]|nr:hypothetical protein HDU93_004523 [Gonapodya sp. JEL0774]
MDPDEPSHKQKKDLDLEMDDERTIAVHREALHQSRAAHHHKHSADEKAPTESKSERRAREREEAKENEDKEYERQMAGVPPADDDAIKM